MIVATTVARAVRGRFAIVLAFLVPLAVVGFALGAIGDADDAASRIPAAIVNDDELVTQTAADGTSTPVFAGRQLVTELTGDSGAGFDWSITNAADAERDLAAGEVYAVLTIPAGFSESILSLQSQEPIRSTLAIRTDDAHSYATAPLAEAVATGMASAFGRTITERYLAGLFGSLGDVGGSLDTAATGAEELASGAVDLGGGVAALADGAASAASGAQGLASGIGEYSGGVGSIASGLATLNAGAAELDGVSGAVGQFTGGVSGLSAAIAAEAARLTDDDPDNDEAAAATLAAVSAQLSGVAAGGATLAQQTTGAIDGIQSGISRSAAGAADLNAGSSALSSGASSLVGGLNDLAAGATTAASGAEALSGGAAELAAGLRAGADQIPSSDTAARSELAGIVTEPVTVTVERANPVPTIGQELATLLLPVGLWFGALASLLVLRGASRSTLLSSATTGRLLWLWLGRAGLLAVAQAIAAAVLVQIVAGVGASAFPAILGFSVLVALAFTAVHLLLRLWLGRSGAVVSLLLLALQIVSTGGLYPVDALADPFGAISATLPLTHAVDGIQGILSGAGTLLPSVVALLLVLALGVVGSYAALRRSRAIRIAVPMLA